MNHSLSISYSFVYLDVLKILSFLTGKGGREGKCNLHLFLPPKIFKPIRTEEKFIYRLFPIIVLLMRKKLVKRIFSRLSEAERKTISHL